MPSKTNTAWKCIAIFTVRVFDHCFLHPSPAEISSYVSFLISLGGAISIRRPVREGVVKIVKNDDKRTSCPHFDQVRLIAFQNVLAKGPMLARAMARKALGNEEFCMQIDAHTDFIKDWDHIVKSEWLSADNEFGIISNVPADKAAKSDYDVGGALHHAVPRQCAIRFLENGFPVRCFSGLMVFHFQQLRCQRVFQIFLLL